VKLFTPARLRALTLRNRVIKSATFEGMSPGGAPSPALTEHHRRLAAGGVGLTTVAYCAVEPGGRSFGEQMVMSPALVDALRPLTRAVAAEGGAAALQLTHCGFFTKLGRDDGRPRAPSRVFNAYGALSGIPLSQAMTEEEIAATIAAFADAAALAKDAGFAAVELHMGHGYLLSQFLTPAINRRRDRWGGSIDGRLRMPLAVVRAARAAVGDDFPLIAKINLRDGFRGGLELAEAIAVARALEGAGVDLLVLSGGYTSKTPFFLLRGGRPLRDMVAVETSWAQRAALRLFGPLYVKRYPFSEMFLRDLALAVRAAVKMPLALLGGLVSRANLERAAADGFDFVALARALIADPDLVVRMARGELERTRCDACNRCVALMDDGGVRCVLDDPPAV
jgi:2,4-dienoyl-CoA reductase-like NADH-dependent reductase (Old Yellow Enzyme family)